MLHRSLSELRRALQREVHSTESWDEAINNAACISCETDWEEGLEFLLAQDLNVISRLRLGTPRSPLELALSSGSRRCAQILLEAPYAISDPVQCLESALHGDAINPASNGEQTSTEMFLAELVLRRRELKRLALLHIPTQVRSSMECLCEDAVPDGAEVKAIIGMLEEAGVDISPVLRHEIYTTLYKCVGNDQFSVSTVQLMWEAGFQDIPFHETLGDSLLRTRVITTFGLEGRMRYCERQLSIGHWLQGHSGIRRETAEDENNVMLQLAYRLGIIIARQWWETNDAASWRLNLSRGALAFLARILLAQHSDRYACYCSEAGCSGVDRMLHVTILVMQETTLKWAPDCPEAVHMRATVRYLGVLLMPVIASMDRVKQVIFRRAMRAILFASLQQRHICCNFDRNTTFHKHIYFGDYLQIQKDVELKGEIQEEDKADAMWFESLLVDMVAATPTTDTDIGEWLQAEIDRCALAGQSSTMEVDPEYIKDVESLGVRVECQELERVS